ncbi:MAG: putative methyltransferase [Hydrocarboniphaga sp.]|uniref:class I SAM-dependent methyltransferase n=1 Tax=Hydrocarboniphaga sp. TaxID=2033016 RepID=UPI00260E9ED9|nr:methyltransferase domain-containing protein [Hydrocarboniphaga sp.]MDB5969515.1 putative methyltransferase [Hydrocarboniphaga sp.]
MLRLIWSAAARPVAAAVVAATTLMAGCASPPPPVEAPQPITLEQAIAAPYRAANQARDIYRHPQQTLEFFGVEDDMTVVEIWPGSGWYTEILAPFLRARGHYVAAQFPDVASSPAYQKKTLANYKSALAGSPQLFDHVRLSAIGKPNFYQPVPPDSADMVLSFRNVHNWLTDDNEREMFAAFYRVLKPGGVLGIVEHRGFDDTTRQDSIRTGYVSQEYVVQLAEDAGFTWVAWEEINANPKDTKDYPGGVWTLPPTLRLGEQDRAKYLAIGESDRMTLKFVKKP